MSETRLRRSGHMAEDDISNEELSLEKDSEVGYEVPSVWKEWRSLVFLVALYALQGIPLGLSFGSVPFLVQKHVTYTQLGVFSFATWPYSLKLLWSPIVDFFYFPVFGRRKSWIVPVQFIIAALLISLSYVAEDWIQEGAIYKLTIVFVILIVVVATQDIAVDGWALTLLSKDHVGHASSCQALGQNIGFFLSYSVFLALSNASFANRFRSEPIDAGLITLSGYLCFCAILFFVFTVYLCFFISEDPHVTLDEDEKEGVMGVYKKMWKMVQLPAIRSLIVLLLTIRVAFVAADNIGPLKLIEYGFPKETLAFMVFLTFPFEVCFPIIIGRWANQYHGSALVTLRNGVLFRCVIALFGILTIASVPSDALATPFFLQVLVLQLFYSFSSNIIFVSQCAFFNQVCDDSFGGTYMTFLNTVANLGGAWPKFLVFYAVDALTCKNGEVCRVFPAGTDGFYPVALFLFVIGIIWFFVSKSRVQALVDLPQSQWKISLLDR